MGGYNHGRDVLWVAITMDVIYWVAITMEVMCYGLL